MPPLELVRMLLGLSIPFLLATHFAGSRLAYELYDREDDYARVVRALWANDKGFQQLSLMCIAWLHGCLGIHFLLRHRRAYRERFHFLFGGALLLPVLAGLGFLAMARELSLRPVQARRQASPRWRQPATRSSRPQPPKETRTFTAVGDAVNTAARLQELCKAYEVRLVASEQVLQAAGVDLSGWTKHTLSIRGRSEGLGVYAVASPASVLLPVISGA